MQDNNNNTAPGPWYTAGISKTLCSDSVFHNNDGDDDESVGAYSYTYSNSREESDRAR